MMRSRDRLNVRRIAPALLVGLAAWAIFTARPGDPRLYSPNAGEAIPLYLIDNGFHSDVVLARQVMMSRPHVAARAAAMTSANPWIEIGWGDAKFYTAEGFSTARALDAGRAM